MKCEECQTLIEEYVADELGAGTTGAMSAHFDFCDVCRELYEEERREQEIYSRYLLAVRPDAGLWKKLEARIEREHPAARIFPFRTRTTKIFGETHADFALRAAAALLLMIGGVLLVAMFTARRDVAPGGEMAAGVTGERTEPSAARAREVANTQGAGDEVVGKSNAKAPARTRAAFASAADERRVERKIIPRAAMSIANRESPTPKALVGETPGKIVSEAESQHLEAIALLTRDIAARRAESSAESAARYDEALGAIDKVIDDTRRAVRGNPNDPVAVQHLLAAYGRKIDVLEELASLDD